ncbi:uncharacterized protein Z519_02289 [Cladophialophora bantiana CBS 173.52]|uniref:Uncharacterized protein n=1 Tax=Cladophialophora bantiana (strain ATCC 10958 / CBS 173.52 / CDC B-1940 / NIH 8579) TaxID=1442370 RepID=A0A0D2HTZ7_CLAB1|nr:uncharacterized protein Z519_02289 [Cladophialophora bantiana CBS 173.52]KIW96898.1 hypothetical protein Z519_02289 [Cladophialophora bantiana CBS 173.52]
MAKELVSKPSSSSSSSSGSFDLRRSLRTARARPWLVNSVLRGRSTAAGVKDSEVAPSLSATTTVTIVSDPPPTATVGFEPEKQSSDNTTAEAKAATSVKAQANAKAIGSKIPVPVRPVLHSPLSRLCGSISLDKEGDLGKDKPTATSPTVTEEAASASRIPVRIKVLPSGPRPALEQVRLSEPLVAHAEIAVDKEAGNFKKRGTVGGFRPLVRRPEAMSIQSCINPEPIRSHRADLLVKSILKHRLDLSETERTAPTSAGHGVTSAAPDQKKSVTFAPTLKITPARCWPKHIVPEWRCRECDNCGHLSWCRELVGAKLGLQVTEVWLKDQQIRGHDYLKHSGGFLSKRGSHPPMELWSF